jgi:hypothetical protein
MRPFRCLTLASALVLAGCASKLQVAEISPTAPAGPIAGIPFRVPQQYDVEVYQKTPKGYQSVYTKAVTLPDPKRVFVLGFESQVLSNGTADFQMNDDNTLKQVGLKSESKGAGFLTEAGTQVGAYATAKQGARDAKTAREKAAQGELDTQAADVTKASGLAITADKAWQGALLADLQAQNLHADPAAAKEALLVADQKARSAKLDANEAARLAGKPAYFPEVVP